MERQENTIDLGTASAETRGPVGTGFDMVLGQGAQALSDD